MQTVPPVSVYFIPPLQVMVYPIRHLINYTSNKLILQPLCYAVQNTSNILIKCSLQT